MRSQRIPAIAIVAVALLSAAPALADPVYDITDLGTLGNGSVSFGYGISPNGEVTGYSFVDSANSTYHAFLYDGSTMEDLGTLSGPNYTAKYSTGYDVNASGKVTGESHYTPSFGTHAFLYDGSSMHDLGTLSGGAYSYGRGINASGEVAGYSYVNGFSAIHAFLYDGTTMRDLGTLTGGRTSEGYDINASGEVTGWSDAPLTSQQAFLYNGTTMLPIPTLGGADSLGYAVNDSGEVAGWSDTSTNAEHAFLYNGSTSTDLGTLGGTHSEARDLNDSGEVVGYSYTDPAASFCAVYVSTPTCTAFLYDAGTMFDLNDLISPSDPLDGDVYFLYAEGINDSDQISAYGCYTAPDGQTAPLYGECHAFRLDLAGSVSTVPEPASLALFGGGLIAFGFFRRFARKAA